MNKKPNVLGNSATVSIGGLSVGNGAHRAYGSGSGSRKYRFQQKLGLNYFSSKSATKCKQSWTCCRSSLDRN